MAIVNQVVICGGTGCMSGNSEAIKNEFLTQLEACGIQDEVSVYLSGCFGLCEKGPVVVVFPEMTFYSHVKVEDVKEICEEHLLKGRVVVKKAYTEVSPEKVREVKSFQEMTFYKNQKRIALKNCGMVDPYSFEEAVGANTYLALGQALTEMTPF